MKGFTLIELIISIGVLGILAAVGFINIVEYKQRHDLGSATQEIVTVIRNAQDRSMSQESGSCWGIYFENPIGGTDFFDLFKGTSYATNTVVSHVALPANIQFDIPVAGSTSTVIFSPVTGLPDSSATIKISLITTPTASSTIVINNNGKIQY